jgi:methylenetetrahydrofolate reductase (NADPH)
MRNSRSDPGSSSNRHAPSAEEPNKSPNVSPAISSFSELLHAGRFAVTAEIAPPASADPQALLARALPLHGLADAVNVTDGAQARASMSALAAAAILVRHDIEPILQMSCRDRNRIALQSDLLGASALGIRNLLMLRGDDPSAGDQADATPVFDLDTQALVATAATMRDRGELPSGRALQGQPSFFIGATDSPLDPPPGWTPDRLRAKIDAGVQFVQTQFCMDVDILTRYLQRLADEGLDERLFVLVGVAPLASARSAHWMREHLPGVIIPESIVARLERAEEPRAEGQRICVELMRELSALKGVAGAHVMAPRNESAIAPTIAEFRRSQ